MNRNVTNSKLNEEYWNDSKFLNKCFTSFNVYYGVSKTNKLSDKQSKLSLSQINGLVTFYTKNYVL